MKVKAKATSQAAVKYDTKYEALGAQINPEVKEYVELEEVVMKAADALGIGKEVRTLYHTASMGSRVGAVVGTATDLVMSGGSMTALGGAGAMAGMMAGMVGGLIIGALGLFGDDEEEAREKARKLYEARVAAMLSRLDLQGFVALHEQDATMMRLATFLSGHRELVAKPEAMAELYRTLSTRLTGDNRKVFESVSNLSRWAQSLVEWRGYSQEKAKEEKRYERLFQSQVRVDRAARARVDAQLQANIKAESKRLEALMWRIPAGIRVAAHAEHKARGTAPKPTSGHAVVVAGGLAAAGVVAAAFFLL